MAPSKRQDKFELELISSIIACLHKRHVALFNTRALRQTLSIVRRRYEMEGMSFLTKTLPKLGKSLDKALSHTEPLDAKKLRFQSLPNSKLPRFLGELFRVVLDDSGVVLPDARAEHVSSLRQVLYLFYKYKLPFTSTQQAEAIAKFERTESELSASDQRVSDLWLETLICDALEIPCESKGSKILSKAQKILSDLLRDVDLTNIIPAHGPGAVATKQRLHEKYAWVNVSERLRAIYPIEQYFCCSVGHYVDRYNSRYENLGNADLPARIICVPKDSRGPRIISSEPVEFQWIQQGVMHAMVQHIETHPLTRWNVFHTDQTPNQCGALLGSKAGKYATLDLNEASDRVSMVLVKALFPEHIFRVLEATRSSSTLLPSGKKLVQLKHAPMGSGNCFWTLSLCVWALLTAAAPDEDTRNSILVYGDDVIVPTAYAGEAIETLESFGLKINRDKSCLQGFFRESCGVDAFKGTRVTPVRARTVWTSARSANAYVSWLAYANEFYARGYYETYDLIVSYLVRLYGEIPSKDLNLGVPSLVEVPESARPSRSRVNRYLQKREWYAYFLKIPRVTKEIDGWDMLLRYFTEGTKVSLRRRIALTQPYDPFSYAEQEAMALDERTDCFSVASYTPRRRSMLRRRWLQSH